MKVARRRKWPGKYEIVLHPSIIFHSCLLCIGLCFRLAQLFVDTEISLLSKMMYRDLSGAWAAARLPTVAGGAGGVMKVW
jgi:hypothetical protein